MFNHLKMLFAFTNVRLPMTLRRFVFCGVNWKIFNFEVNR